MRRALALALAALVLHLVLIQPNHPGALTWGALRLVPLELPAILLALVALRGRAARALRAVLVALLLAAAALKLADLAMFTAFRRGFNAATDLPLILDGWRLGSGVLGAGLAALAATGAFLALAALAALLWWAAGRWAAVEPPRPWRAGAGAGALLACAVVVAEIGEAHGRWRLPVEPPGAAFTARVGLEHAALYGRTLRDLAAFAEAARADPFAAAAPLLDRIGAHDVLVVFVESYGRASLENPLYAPAHRATLAKAEQALGEAGLAARSAWLAAPTVGGQSWLSHATLASGLAVTDGARHRALLASPRRGLFHLAQEAGFRTAAVMPAITLPWPEAARMGFDTVLAAADLGYEGEPFDWVTMPDQFTLLAMDRLLRDGRGDAPLFAQVALISSHAPWVPIPPLIAWEAVGDGAVFDRWARSGDPPEEVWRDPDRVRAAYRDAVDYSLRTVLAYAERQADDPPLLVVLGDHQAARFVAGSESRDVPIHLIGPPDLVAAAEAWGWSEGLLPTDGAPTWPMEAFRDRFLAAFTVGLGL